jgi:hypothetical protein
MFQTKATEKIKTRGLHSVTVCENRTVYGIMWEIMIEPDRPQMAIWRMRIACWIPKTTDTHNQCVILVCFSTLKWLRERASILRYTYIGCHVTERDSDSALLFMA